MQELRKRIYLLHVAHYRRPIWKPFAKDKAERVQITLPSPAGNFKAKLQIPEEDSLVKSLFLFIYLDFNSGQAIGKIS